MHVEKKMVAYHLWWVQFIYEKACESSFDAGMCVVKAYSCETRKLEKDLIEYLGTVD